MEISGGQTCEVGETIDLGYPVAGQKIKPNVPSIQI